MKVQNMTKSVKRAHPKLPIFCLKIEGQDVLYTPGHLTKVNPIYFDAVQHYWNIGQWPSDSTAHIQQVADVLQRHAQRAVQTWRQMFEGPFVPECLTVYLSNHCNLACPYCYVAAGIKNRSSFIINEKIVLGAARLVARSCAEQGKPFSLVLHGGGEPTLHWGLVQRLVSKTRQIANQIGIDWFGYIATNGILSEAKARWLAEQFTLVGLSCDGPPDIQDQQRPLADGRPSSANLKRTAHILVAAGGRFEVRSTITPQSAERQLEIVDYLYSQLGATEARFEPVYRLRGVGRIGFSPGQAKWFVDHFIEAQSKAQSLGCKLTFSGVRLDEIHGPYCSLLRNVLHLTPDGKVTACFFCTDCRQSGAYGLVVGDWDNTKQEFVLDADQIASHRRKASLIPAFCHECLNIYHCTRACPEVCLATTPSQIDSTQVFASPSEETPGFRCLVQRQLAEIWILELAKPIIQS